jgi:hypothetical protein
MSEQDVRLVFDPDALISRTDVLESAPADAAPLIRKLWSRRDELSEWVAGNPERAQQLVVDPVAALREALPDLELPDVALPGEDLRRLLLERIETERLEVKLEDRDPQTSDALRLLGRVSEAVAAGTLTPAALADATDTAVRAVADPGVAPETVTRVIEAIRFVLGGAVTIGPPFGSIVIAVEEFAQSFQPPRPD